MIATSMRTLVRCLPSPRIAACVSLLAGAALALPTSASAAVSSSVRNACMSDYFAYCAGLEVGSKELRSCMSRAGPKLSASCVSALVAAGEVSQAEVNRRSGGSKVASAPRKSRIASAPRRAVVKVASRSACVSGPARPGASSSNSCRSNVASTGSRRRSFATLR